jgi:hypothetical protein
VELNGAQTVLADPEIYGATPATQMSLFLLVVVAQIGLFMVGTEELGKEVKVVLLYAGRRRLFALLLPLN